jgi:hypothetical protein
MKESYYGLKKEKKENTVEKKKKISKGTSEKILGTCIYFFNALFYFPCI